jgi:hypothetical protein
VFARLILAVSRQWVAFTFHFFRPVAIVAHHGGSGLTDRQYWATSLRNDSFDLVRSESENDGSECSEILRA